MLLREAGLDDVRVEEVAVPNRAESFDHWWTRTTALAGPLSGMIAAMPEAPRTVLRARLRDDVEPFRVPGGYELPGLTLLASARRPGGLGHQRNPAAPPRRGSAPAAPSSSSARLTPPTAGGLRE